MLFGAVTGSPASLNGVWQTGLSLEDADDLADLLSRLDRERELAQTH
jgi:hypothetical protein